jgi:hypothetical protein
MPPPLPPSAPCPPQELTLSYKDRTLLLPVTIEHTVDERSPLFGHTQESLRALNAEVVVVFEGTTELGESGG